MKESESQGLLSEERGEGRGNWFHSCGECGERRG
jgi:hypothetical protein